MYQLDIFCYFILSMGEGAKAFVLAFLDVALVELAKLSLVPVGMVELLKFVMGELAVLIIALLFGTKKVAVLDSGRPSLIFIIVIVQTGFSLMNILIITGIKYFF